MREGSEVRDEDSDNSGQDDEADPCLEVNRDTGHLAAAGKGAATEALATVDSSIDGFLEKEPEVVATVRYRASYGDIDESSINYVADIFAEVAFMRSATLFQNQLSTSSVSGCPCTSVTTHPEPATAIDLSQRTLYNVFPEVAEVVLHRLRVKGASLSKFSTA